MQEKVEDGTFSHRISRDQFAHFFLNSTRSLDDGRFVAKVAHWKLAQECMARMGHNYPSFTKMLEGKMEKAMRRDCPAVFEPRRDHDMKVIEDGRV